MPNVDIPPWYSYYIMENLDVIALSKSEWEEKENSEQMWKWRYHYQKNGMLKEFSGNFIFMNLFWYLKLW